MTDSVRITSPSDRVEDANGNPVSGAKLKFFVAGTSTPKEVYADAALGTSLGSIVYCDSGGYPVTTQGGATKTAIYTGTAAYKVQITDSSDVDVIPAQDNQRGASDLSIYSTTTATNNEPTIAKSANYTVVSGDGYKTVVCTHSGGSFTLTLPSAVTVTDGWWIECYLKSPATSNTVTLATVSAQTIAHHNTAGTSLILSGGGSGGKIKSDGANWIFEPYQTTGGGFHVETTIASSGTTNLGASASDVVAISGTTTITSFGTVANAVRWVRFTGALTLTHNATTLILPNAANITTAAGDCGLFVSDSSGNWRCWYYMDARGAATQANMEAASSATVFITPSVQTFHPTHPKDWLYADLTSSTPTIAGSSGVSSLTDIAVGNFDINLTTAYSSVNYSMLLTAGTSVAAQERLVAENAQADRTTSKVEARVVSLAGTGTDAATVNAAGLGDR